MFLPQRRKGPQILAARGRSPEGRVTAKRGRILGDDEAPARSREEETMHIHWEESATTKTAPFRRNPSGAGGFGPQALSLVGHDEKTSLHSSLRACNPKTPARGRRDFCHGLLGRVMPGLSDTLWMHHMFPVNPGNSSGLYHPNREQRSCQTALDSRSRQRVNAPTLRGGDDNEDNAVSPEPFGPMGVAGDIFVASRRRCDDIDFRLAPRSPRQDPSALLPIRVVKVTSSTRIGNMFFPLRLCGETLSVVV